MTAPNAAHYLDRLSELLAEHAERDAMGDARASVASLDVDSWDQIRAEVAARALTFDAMAVIDRNDVAPVTLLRQDVWPVPALLYAEDLSWILMPGFREPTRLAFTGL